MKKHLSKVSIYNCFKLSKIRKEHGISRNIKVFFFKTKAKTFCNLFLFLFCFRKSIKAREHNNRRERNEVIEYKHNIYWFYHKRKTNEVNYQNIDFDQI